MVVSILKVVSNVRGAVIYIKKLSITFSLNLRLGPITSVLSVGLLSSMAEGVIVTQGTPEWYPGNHKSTLGDNAFYSTMEMSTGLSWLVLCKHQIRKWLF